MSLSSSSTCHIAHAYTRFGRFQQEASTCLEQVAYNINVLVGKVIQGNLEHMENGMCWCHSELGQLAQKPDILSTSQYNVLVFTE